ncbi:right-handed parallel beta-helix repeat-containing protein [Acaryochloris sp. IP29b_bin.148]|uniref:right-handed parallel beta-helix repeat-containing protein n=1 Tax=Acaryochloris sp. IP29b_bin.148 TaxID=2969218 RepID=UPI00262923AD|nr:right-handed parallel beta-helix repeat-containing protein [Acaryochloris sp. IP29b_bin.148]
MSFRSTLQSDLRRSSLSGRTVMAWAALVSLVTCSGLGLSRVAHAQTPNPSSVRVVVNSNLDGKIRADEALTLREAIALTNGTLNKADLSAAEQAQITPSLEHSRIEFDLPSDQTTIRLRALLPTILQPGLVVDGTSQTGYVADKGSVPAPVVALTAAEDVEVFRGLTIAADQVQVKGLSFYGFTAQHQTTATTPPADIFIAHRLVPEKHREEDNPEVTYPYEDEQDIPPQGVVIEANWLGLSPEGMDVQAPRSAFGVSIYNAVGTRILNNRIANHDSSAVITSVRAEQTEIANNMIAGNGVAGMPDAIRLEGRIAGSQIRANQITNNAGSGIYLYRPEGAIQIKDNQIVGNGQRFRRAAVVLMGDDHQVIGNTIQDQPGPGVLVTAYPTSNRNIIQENQFANLKGLSIDLIARDNRFLDRFSRLSINSVDLAARSSTRVQDYQIGDGPNPPRNSDQRQRDTANRGINTPQFFSSVFYWMDGQVHLDGKADPGAEVVLYQVLEQGDLQGPLSKPMMSVTADEEGRFTATLTDVQPGDQFSAIATHPDYGTSEPALNVEIQLLDVSAE